MPLRTFFRKKKNSKCFMQNFTFIAFCVNIFAKITVWKKTVIDWIQGSGYFFYMLRNISRSYLGLPHDSFVLLFLVVVARSARIKFMQTAQTCQKRSKLRAGSN